MTARAFHIQKDFRRGCELVPEIERIDLGRPIFRFRPQAVGSRVFRGKRSVPLQNDIGLPGDPVAAGVRMWEEGDRADVVRVRFGWAGIA